VGLAPNRVSVAFARRGASGFRGWLALPVSRSPSTGPDAEELPPLSPFGAHSNPSPPLRRPSGPLATLALRTTEAVRKSWVPLLEFLKDRPSTSIPACVLSRLPEVRACHTRTRSALVVSHDLGGFLRTRLRGFVAPRSRSWGSPGFLPARTTRAVRSDIPPCVLSPSKLLPSCSGCPVTRIPASAPLVHGTASLRIVPLSPASRRCSALGSRTLRVATANASSSLGVPSTQAFTRASRLFEDGSLRKSSDHAPERPSPLVAQRRLTLVTTASSRQRLSPTQRPLCSARSPSHPRPRGHGS